MLISLCALLAAVGLVWLDRMHGEATAQVTRTRQAGQGAFALIQAAIDAESNQRDFLMSGESARLDGFHDAVRRARSRLAALRRLNRADPAFMAALARADAQAAIAFSQLEGAAALRARAPGAVTPAPGVILSSEQAMNDLLHDLNALLQVADASADAARAYELRTNVTLTWIVGALGMITLLAAGAAIWSLRAENRSWRAAVAILAQAKNEADAAHAAAAASDLAKSRFLAAASHDMRQPLHALALYVNALKRRVSGDEAPSIVARMERAVDSLSGMFATLLDLARIEARAVEAEFSVLALRDCIDAVCAEFPGAPVHPPEPPTRLCVYSDRLLLERLMRNLIANALAHGGGEAWITAIGEGDKVIVSVIDRGRGIAKEDQIRIFDEFVRLDPQAKTEGLGLGLTIVRRIAHIIGAELTLRSSPGEGAWFIASLPRAASADAAAPSVEAQSGSLDGAAIIAIDDDPLVLTAMAHMLQDAGANVVTCADAAELRAQLAQGARPDLIITDFRIGGALCGATVARTASAHLRPTPPILIVTGDTSPETIQMLGEMGLPWLVKPVSADDLMRAARGLIANAR